MPQTQKYIEVPKVDPKVAATEMAPLQDVVAPPAVSMWPQTAGWYVVGALLLAGVAWMAWRWFRHWQANRYRREALAELATLGPRLHDPALRPGALRALAALVKRTQLSESPRPDVAPLAGETWRTQLSSTMPAGAWPAESTTLLVQLSSLREERLAQVSSQEAAELVTAVRHWISAHHAGVR